ncbi:MAG: hypothetical protein HYS21_08020 [Deltaproteobacteria bacterium]|nr:hypothetical protein [Deltaproteobacteria bacterium]
MKKIVLGILLGIVVLAVFLYFGGAKYVKTFGSKTQEAGQKLEKYEKGMKDTVKQTEEKVKETAKDAKEAVDKTVDSTKKAVDKTKDAMDQTKKKVKEYMPE